MVRERGTKSKDEKQEVAQYYIDGYKSLKVCLKKITGIVYSRGTHVRPLALKHWPCTGIERSNQTLATSEARREIARNVQRRMRGQIR